MLGVGVFDVDMFDELIPLFMMLLCKDEITEHGQ